MTAYTNKLAFKKLNKPYYKMFSNFALLFVVASVSSKMKTPKCFYFLVQPVVANANRGWIKLAFVTVEWKTTTACEFAFM